MVTSKKHLSSAVRMWLGRGLDFVYSFHFARMRVKEAGHDLIANPMMGKEFRNEVFTKIVTDFLNSRITAYAQSVPAEKTLHNEIGTFVAEIARSENLFIDSGIRVAIPMAWRVLLFEDMGPPGQWEPWYGEMLAVDPNARGAAKRYRDITETYWMYVGYDDRRDPYEEVREWAKTQAKYARIQSQLESYLARLLNGQ